MRISRSEIEYYIPQRTPFIMIDNLKSVTPEKFESNFRVLPDNIFVENGILREFALIENIAQSSAAGLALTNKSSGKSTAEGFIGGIAKLKLYDLPKVNDSVNTIVNLVSQFKNMFLVKGENYVNGKKLLECELTLVGA